MGWLCAPRWFIALPGSGYREEAGAGPGAGCQAPLTAAQRLDKLLLVHG